MWEHKKHDYKDYGCGLTFIQVTQQDIQDACKKQVYRNKKKYYRKTKHKNNEI